jgi:hypothetical protein
VEERVQAGDRFRFDRVYAVGAVLTALAALACAPFSGKAALGLLLGGAGAVIGFRWLEASVGRIAARPASRRGLAAAGSFLLRLGFWGVLAWGAAGLGTRGAAGFLAGIAILLLAILAEGLRGGRDG